MKIKIFVMAFMFFSSASCYANKNCMDNAATNTEMKQCARIEYEAAIGEMDAEYTKIVKEYSTDHDSNATVVVERLDASQKAWLIFRDVNCKLVASSMLGGSGESLIQGLCLGRMTRERTAELKRIQINNW